MDNERKKVGGDSGRVLGDGVLVHFLYHIWTVF